MGVTFYKIVLYISVLFFVISAYAFLTSIYAFVCARKEKKCTQKGTATLIQASKHNWRDASQHFEIAYSCNGKDYQIRVPEERAEEGLIRDTSPGTQLPIWYDPEKPERVVIAEDPPMQKTAKSWKRIRKRGLILMIIFGCLVAYALPRSVSEEQTPQAMTTIGALSDEIKAVAEKSPSNLIFTESIGSPDTFCIAVDDPAFAQKALSIILNASVSTRGCQVDMAQYRYEEYRFDFGGEIYTFGFLPHSYFHYDGEYYELGRNQLGDLCASLHGMMDAEEAAVEPRSKWYGDDAVLETDFLDNGDEARSRTELTRTVGGESLTGAIEGAYDVLDIDRQPDCYVIRYTYGDFYSHEAIRSSRVTVENGKMVIENMES